LVLEDPDGGRHPGQAAGHRQGPPTQGPSTPGRKILDRGVNAMSDRRDWDGEMTRFPIDDTTAERLLSGGLSPGDAPPGYAGRAGMIQAPTGPTIPAE